MINKRQYTLKQLEYLKPLIEFKSDFCIVKIGEEFIQYTDVNPQSDFYFRISLLDFKNQKLEITIDYKPSSQIKFSSSVAKMLPKDILGILSFWISLLINYNEFPLEVDQILKEYTDDYFAEFILVDDPSNDKPLKVPQALLLDEYLKYVVTKIDDFSEEIARDDIEEIKNDVIELRSVVTKVKKSEIVKRMSIISAKMTKAGLSFIKEFLSEAKKEGIKKILSWAIENGPGLAEGLIKQLTKHP